MVFFEFRDTTGSVQGVVLPNNAILEECRTIREECVVEVLGKVNERPDRNKKADVINGDIELEIVHIKVLSQAEVLPFPINEDTINITESQRLTHRYLDLRSKRMHKNIKQRFLVQKFVRDFLSDQEFIEIETPLLSAPTPEGSRSFIVPSRTVQGSFYSLPQSPQQYKQLLMTAGFEKYFQFARCLRDEDSRGDRQPEFTQLDMELAFVSEEDIMRLNEELLIKLIAKLYPEKTIQQIPFPRISYKKSMDKYGNDRPDIRNDKSDPNSIAFVWVVDFPMFEKTDKDNIDQTGEWTFTHNPFSKPKDEYLDIFMNKENIGDILSTQYDIVLNGFEIGGGSTRSYLPQHLKNTFEIMGYSEDQITTNFGHILEAFRFGTPPHGGIAWGFDRLMMLLENEPNIREVIPFAKTGEGKDLMMNAPNIVNIKQLKELGISTN
jgi:aspartyl-tRNA synthetase